MVAAFLLLVFASVQVGGSGASLADWRDPEARSVLLISRVPRTLALLLCGASLAVAGLILQLLTQNRFVEPATAGTIPSATLGMLLCGVLWPGAPVWLKMLVASGCALGGTLLFLGMLARLSLRSALVVPLVGIMLGAVIGAATTFLAVHFELLQSLAAWTAGDFSAVLRGRYELLWLAGALTLAAYLVADRFAVAGMGREMSVSLGLDYRRAVALGVCIVALVGGVVTVVVGVLPFVGLIVPNLVSLVMGDRLRQSLPWVCLAGAALTLACDVAGRLLVHPFEIPAGSVMGVAGAALFLAVLLKGGRLEGR